MLNEKLHGVIVPVITPLDAGENIDRKSFRRILRRLIAAGVHGIFVGGSAGEGPLLGDAAWRRMVETALDEVGEKVPLLCGVMDVSARKVCEKIRLVKELGGRRFVLTPTYYITVKSAAEHLRLFGLARDAAGDMEMIAYNIPQCTGSRLDVETICEMARRGWIRCCKESSGDWKYLKSLIRRGKELGLDVLAGDELQMDQALLAGAKGIVPVCANVDPRQFLRLHEAGIGGRRKTLSREMNAMLRLRATLLLSGVCWIAGIKYAMSALGYGADKCVSPLEPAETRRKSQIDTLLKKFQRNEKKTSKRRGGKTAAALR